MSEIKVNKISPRTACGTTTLGDSGDTFTIPAGVTITNSGTAAGFGATGAASWDTTVKTTGFTAVSGVGYFVNTTAGAITVTLPASPSAGDVVAVSDYAGTADTNNITLGRNSSNIEGDAADFVINQRGISITLVYVDATKGWITTDTGNSSNAYVNDYVEATGGTITCSGDYRIHTFTGPGTLCVTSGGTPSGSTLVDYLVIAGGAGGAVAPAAGGGGGAGGYRESSGTATGSYTASPLGACVSALPVSVTAYPVIVGGGGPSGATGSNSTFSSIVSTGGGEGGIYGGGQPVSPASLAATFGASGGSGGGGGATCSGGPGSSNTLNNGGTGNTPPVSPLQGRNGGAGWNAYYYASGGGGGAGVVGSDAAGADTAPNSVGGAGGNGVATSISGSSVTRAGGGGGQGFSGTTSGGTGGGGTGADVGNPGETSGTINTGGGGGSGPTGGAGGSGIVIIRYKFQN